MEHFNAVRGAMDEEEKTSREQTLLTEIRKGADLEGWRRLLPIADIPDGESARDSVSKLVYATNLGDCDAPRPSASEMEAVLGRVELFRLLSSLPITSDPPC